MFVLPVGLSHQKRPFRVYFGPCALMIFFFNLSRRGVSILSLDFRLQLQTKLRSSQAFTLERHFKIFFRVSAPGVY